MKTAEQAKELWCPMARVAQVGVLETTAAYNRALSKVHVPIKVGPPKDKDVEQEDDADSITMSVLKVDMQLSGAAHCVSDKCAMWRNVTEKLGYCGLAPLHKTA